MKKCVSCNKLKSESQFNYRFKALGILHTICRDCNKAFQKKWYEDNKARHLEKVHSRKRQVRDEARNFVYDYLSTHPCQQCGEGDPVVLEFHHLAGKARDISFMVGAGYPIHAILKEISKTEVLCANCHRKRTMKERGWFRGRK